MTGLNARDPDDRAEQLAALTDRLTAAVVEETRAFEARRPQDAVAGQAAMAGLAATYRLESARVTRDPALISPASEARRQRLVQATIGFEAALARHARALHAARIVTEGLVQAIAAEVAAVRAPGAGYGASARATQGDGSAIALNTRA